MKLLRWLRDSRQQLPQLFNRSGSGICGYYNSQYNLDVTKLEEALSDRTKAVMVAHTLGNPFESENSQIILR